MKGHPLFLERELHEKIKQTKMPVGEIELSEKNPTLKMNRPYKNGNKILCTDDEWTQIALLVQ